MLRWQNLPISLLPMVPGSGRGSLGDGDFLSKQDHSPGVRVVAPGASSGQMWVLLMTWNCREGMTPHTAPSWSPRPLSCARAQLPHLLPCTARALVFSPRASGCPARVLGLLTYRPQLSLHVSMLYPKLLLKTTFTTLAGSHLKGAILFVFTNPHWTSCSDGISINSLISLWGLGCLSQKTLAGLAVSGSMTYW